jgi:hypothetical protein
MTNLQKFAHRLTGSPHLIKWTDADIRKIADLCGITGKLPSALEVYAMQVQQRRAKASFTLNPIGENTYYET